MLLKPFRLLLSLATILMVFFQAYRLLFLLLKMGDTEASLMGFYFSLSWGLRMDLVITSYLMIVPAILLTIHHIIRKKTNAFKTAIKIYFLFAILVITAIVATDIPYYNFYTERISSSVFLWFSTPDAMLDFVKGNMVYFPFFLGFVVFLYIGIKYFYKKINSLTESTGKGISRRILTGILVLGVLFICMRGGIQSRPISSKDGAKNTTQFYNHLSVNPILYFSESLTVPSIDYMPYEKASEISKSLFPESDFNKKSPISRNVKGDSQASNLNVVLILVESLSSEMVGFAGGRKGVTQFLDSMAPHSMAFTNCYSTGVHTYNGIYGSLYGLPTLAGKQPMADQTATKASFSGLPGTLQNLGYHTSYICTHELRFDNCEYFLGKNGFNSLISVVDKVKDPPEDNSFGVGDEYLFDFAFNQIKAIAKKDKPFFSTLLTISTHGPHKMGKLARYKPQNPTSPNNVYEYTDNAIRTFIKRCKGEPWYSNTVFVVVGDHGYNFSHNYEVPLKYVQVPLLIFGDSIQPKTFDNVSSQLDIFPTVMGILGHPYSNNSFGVDLNKVQRVFAPFSKDFTLGASDGKHYFIRDKGGQSFLFDLENNPLQNIYMKQRILGDSMKTYCEAIMRTTQGMIERDVVY